MSKVCKDELPADRCSVDKVTCKKCGSNDVEPEDSRENSWDQPLSIYHCNKCDYADCLCSCRDPEYCDICEKQEPCGCPNS